MIFDGRFDQKDAEEATETYERRYDYVNSAPCFNCGPPGSRGTSLSRWLNFGKNSAIAISMNDDFAPPRYHTRGSIAEKDEHLVLLAGHFYHAADGLSEKDNHPPVGTYWFNPRGEERHDECRGNDCRTVIYTREPTTKPELSKDADSAKNEPSAP